MLKRLTKLLLILSAVLLSGGHISARSIKAAVDSSQITMGYQTAIRFEIVDQTGSPSEILVDKGAMPAEVELVDWVYGDTTDLGNGLVEMKRALIVQSFDSGLYTIPAFLLVNGPDTLRTQPITLKVNPVDVSQMSDINPIAPAVEFESKWYDFMPDWLTDYWASILAGLLIIAAGICGYLIMTKKVEVPLLPKKKPVPPYQLAMQRLESLREQNLWQNGQEKEYYTQLIDILRDYLQGRFGINAMEMTSQQITSVLHENETTRMPNERMKRILEIADFVKFAKVRPLPDDNHRALAEAVRFVEETKPAEVLPEDSSAAGSGATDAAVPQVPDSGETSTPGQDVPTKRV